jgi:radical SAM protein with 4Fe4S-binding SPASM domain
MNYPFFPFKMVSNGNKGVRVLSPYANDDIKINSSAASLLNLCNGSRSLDEIIVELCDRFQSTEKEIRGLAKSFIHDFSDRGIIWVKDEKMRWFNAPPPESIFWEITAECNLKCLHCVVSADKKQQSELSTQEGLGLINEWRSMGVRDITFSGGEPLIRKDFFDLVHATKKQNFTIGLATNGTLITPSVAGELKKLQVNIQVSLDGSNADIYGKFRGSKKAFDQAIKGIEVLLSAGHDITIGTVISKHNIDDIPEMLKLVESYGIKYFRLIPFIPCGRGKENSTLELAPEKVKEVSAYLIEERRKRPFEITTLEFEHTFNVPPPDNIDPSQPSECGGALHYCTVTPIGEVLPCHYFEGVSADNVKEQSFSQIWKRSRFLNYFRSLRICDISGYCRQCEWLSVCRGGCKAANFSHRMLFHSNRHCWLVAKNEKTESQETTSYFPHPVIRFNKFKGK